MIWRFRAMMWLLAFIGCFGLFWSTAQSDQHVWLHPILKLQDGRIVKGIDVFSWSAQPYATWDLCRDAKQDVEMLETLNGVLIIGWECVLMSDLVSADV
ncbi:MAG: hypothetical protein AAGG69_00565 [Pseudomonadota bacterium]